MRSNGVRILAFLILDVRQALVMVFAGVEVP